MTKQYKTIKSFMDTVTQFGVIKVDKVYCIVNGNSSYILSGSNPNNGPKKNEWRITYCKLNDDNSVKTISEYMNSNNKYGLGACSAILKLLYSLNKIPMDNLHSKINRFNMAKECD